MLDMPTPEVLEAQANDLEARAAGKEKQAGYLRDTMGESLTAESLLKDAAIFREEATAKRAKAARLIKRDIEAGVRTPSGTLVSTIEAMEAQGQKVWESYLKDIGSTPWGSK